MKYIVVMGGIIGGVGKGVIASSLGTLLDGAGLNVTFIKIDPHITLNKNLSRESYLLDDGGEVDLDFGNYERFVNISLSKDHYITFGKVQEKVIKKERQGDYEREKIQIVPHYTDVIQEMIENVAERPVKDDDQPQVCIIELGGNDYTANVSVFIEALRQLRIRIGPKNFCVLHVSFMADSPASGNLTTKSLEKSAARLRAKRFYPDLFLCRAEERIGRVAADKIKEICQIDDEQMICIPDVNSIYHVPVELMAKGILSFVKSQLMLSKVPNHQARAMLPRWSEWMNRVDGERPVLKITLVGKSRKMENSYMSVWKALEHASILATMELHLTFIKASDLCEDPIEGASSICLAAWKAVKDSDGVIVPGGFGPDSIDGIIRASNWCRVNKKPFLGICLGMQAAVIEFARNVVRLEGADTTEFNPNTMHPVVINIPHNQDRPDSLRQGKRTTFFKKFYLSTIKKLYGSEECVIERHRERYEINPEYIEQLRDSGLRFVGTDQSEARMEIVELEEHPYYVGVQYHPEYTSTPMNPSPPYLGLILAAANELYDYLESDCYIPPPAEPVREDSDDELYFIPERLVPRLVQHDDCIHRLPPASQLSAREMPKVVY